MYIDFIYRIDQLLFNVWRLIRGKTPLSTNDKVKFVDFRSVNYRFKMIYQYWQDLAINQLKIHLTCYPSVIKIRAMVL